MKPLIEWDTESSRQARMLRVLLRLGAWLAFLGGVALVAPYVLPRWSSDGPLPPLAQEITQQTNVPLDTWFCGWGLVAVLLLILTGNEALRRAPHAFSGVVASATLLLSLVFFIPIATNFVTALTSEHMLQFYSAMDWLDLLGFTFIVVGDIIFIPVYWIMYRHDLLP